MSINDNMVFLSNERLCDKLQAHKIGLQHYAYSVFVFNDKKQLLHIIVARMEGHEVHFFDKLIKCDLLILDDFGMKKLEGQQQNDFEQIIDDRYNRKSLIIVSQLSIADWYDVINNELIAEACLDRIVHKAVRFQLKGDSLRKKY